MSRYLGALCVVWLALAIASPAFAQDRISVRGFGTVAVETQAASDSFDAVLGTPRTMSFGGGLQVTNVWRGLFIEAGAEWASLNGERVFVDGSTVVPLGIPVEVTVAPLDVIVGWRFSRSRRFVPYVAAGLTSIAYSESSDFAADDENVDERAAGFVAVGGVEVRLHRLLQIRGELRFRRAGGVLGDTGVSQEFQENNLGGVGAALKLVVGR